MWLGRSWRLRKARGSTTGCDWRRQFPNSGGRRRIPGLSVHCLIRYEAARATHFKMSTGATFFPETQGLPERGLGSSMSWGRGTRVPLARPKAQEQGNSERDREGCDTKPLYYRKPCRRSPAKNSPAQSTPGKTHPKESRTAVK